MNNLKVRNVYARCFTLKIYAKVSAHYMKNRVNCILMNEKIYLFMKEWF